MLLTSGSDSSGEPVRPEASDKPLGPASVDEGTAASGLGESSDDRKRFESIAALSLDAIICADGNNRVTFWNRAAEATFGYSAQEMLGQSLSLIVPPALRATHETGLGRLAAGHRARLVGSLVTVTAVRRDGAEFPLELSLTHWIENGAHQFGAIARDVSDRRAAEAQLRREAEIDHLTGIANRKFLADRMQAACDRGEAAALLLFDLDGFKDVNDSLGHAAGDEVLRHVADRLAEAMEDEGFVARLGGDEFAVLLAGLHDPAKVQALGRRLVASIEKSIEVQERCIYVGASAGVALVPPGSWTPDDLLGDADLALYRAKGDGRSTVRIFTPELRAVSRTRSSVSSSLREAWERREFELYYQPQVQLAGRTLTGAEALIRWNHPTRGLVGPAAFLPVLESSLLAMPVAEWILRTACAQASRWRRAGFPDFQMGVNLFAAQFRSGDLPEMVADALTDFDLPGEALELEITENIILRSDDRMLTDLAALRSMGVGIAFDDYGTGYASLTMLKQYPVTRLKIDRSFVSAVDRSRADQTIVEAIVRLAKGFDLDVIAEGIETAEQAALMEAYCSEGQGYLFGRPSAAPVFEAQHMVPAQPQAARR
ncbi:putative bifunctional diguanylate cyclase/phosphodiesterase [Rubellimicrobium rubrum]|uniref:putative bifunctional diguanylate cyclase/phosphodiesterase n=1 Tax=Rubellimicrobium rubrum TaxID=2585369 RepID=UPI00159BE774|nr:GGDEF domain-containing phosphodiesterase [Rubellimicrobium rubrum]